jgi:hypothetical protein
VGAIVVLIRGLTVPRVKKVVLADMMVREEPIEEARVVEHSLSIPKRCDWLKKEKGTTCFKLGLCIYCKAMTRPD